MQRISTGNRQLDLILCGGLPRHSINVVMGLPGTGKTVLAEQLVFANATPERPALYLSTLSEPLPKLIAYLQELSFADVERIGVEVLYESLGEVLVEDPQQLVASCQRLIEQHRPAVLVVDSFKAIAELVPDRLAWRRLVFELAGLLSAYDVTALWVGEYPSEAAAQLPEFAIADGILELQREETGSRDDRFLRVVKLRGSDFRDGRHAFRISEDGLEVFPRLIGPPAHHYEPREERLRTGIRGLDEMIESGWLRGSSTLIEGPSGSGKTMIGLHFLRQGVRDGEPGLLVNFQESPVQTIRSMKSLGWDAHDLLAPDRIQLFHTSPVELQIDTIVQEMLGRIEAHGVRRVVIDALGDLQKAARDPSRFYDYVYAMTQEFAVRGITALLPFESMPGMPQGVPTAGREVSNMSDNVLLLAMNVDADLVRTIRIVKTRASAHDGSPHVLTIGPGGVEVL
jgi:circadian clock protein KaiC